MQRHTSQSVKQTLLVQFDLQVAALHLVRYRRTEVQRVWYSVSVENNEPRYKTVCLHQTFCFTTHTHTHAHTHRVDLQQRVMWLSLLPVFTAAVSVAYPVLWRRERRPLSPRDSHPLSVSNTWHRVVGRKDGSRWTPWSEIDEERVVVKGLMEAAGKAKGRGGWSSRGDREGKWEGK